MEREDVVECVAMMMEVEGATGFLGLRSTVVAVLLCDHW